MKSDNYESSAFLILSGAKLDGVDKSGITLAMILEEKEWGANIKLNKVKYSSKFPIPISEILTKIVFKVNWNIEKVKLLSINFMDWPDMSIGKGTDNAQLQVIVEGIEIIINYENKNYELKLLYDANMKYVKLVEVISGKFILNSSLDI